MHENPLCFFNLEWPAPGACIHGGEPVLRGWITGKAGQVFSNVRAQASGKIWTGVLGFPRVDLATHFKSDRPWLPAGFAIALTLPEGPAEIALEAQTYSGEWIGLQNLHVVIKTDGESIADHPVRLIGNESQRDPHAPFTGHLEDPATAEIKRQTSGGVFGWLQHAHQPVKAVFASTDLLIFNQLDYDLSRQPEAPESDIPLSLRFAGHADLLPGQSACLRIYAQLADESIHLCFAVHTLLPATEAAFGRQDDTSPPAEPWTDHLTRASDFPSGRPRRLVIGTRNLHECDATLRALDVARHLTHSKRWIIHLVSTVDGPLRSTFEAAGIPVQIVDPRALYRADTRSEGEHALALLSRQISWAHRDAAIIFDPLCFWMMQGATQKKVPVLFDCSEETPLETYFSARLSSDMRGLLDESWQNLHSVCFASATVARRQAAYFNRTFRRAIIPHWAHFTNEIPSRAEARAQLRLPPDLRLAVSFNQPTPQQGSSILLRTFTSKTNPCWLALPRSYPDSDGFSLGRDAVLNHARILMPPQSQPLLWIAAADVVINTALARPTLRPLLDASGAGRPIISTHLSSVQELFAGADIRYIPPGDGHALEQACHEIMARDLSCVSSHKHAQSPHDARIWLPRYHALLESLL